MSESLTFNITEFSVTSVNSKYNYFFIAVAEEIVNLN